MEKWRRAEPDPREAGIAEGSRLGRGRSDHGVAGRGEGEELRRSETGGESENKERGFAQEGGGPMVAPSTMRASTRIFRRGELGCRIRLTNRATAEEPRSA